MLIPTAQARIIADALVRFEAIKPAYVERGKALKLKDVALLQKDMALAQKDTMLASYERSLLLEQRLRLGDQARAAAWRTKAKRRGWVVATLSLALGGLVYLNATN